MPWMKSEPKGSGNYQDLDKTRVKLFPNFTRHHLITYTYRLKNEMYTLYMTLVSGDITSGDLTGYLHDYLPEL